jgi:predicted RNase H-like nuclease (RuvC/YqgF family)
MKDPAAVTEMIDPELTLVRRVPQSERIWRTMALIFGLIIAGGTILWTMGKAFYVTRDEYTMSTQRHAIESTELTLTLNMVKSTMSEQTIQLKELASTIASMKQEIAKKR